MRCLEQCRLGMGLLIYSSNKPLESSAVHALQLHLNNIKAVVGDMPNGQSFRTALAFA